MSQSNQYGRELFSAWQAGFALCGFLFLFISLPGVVKTAPSHRRARRARRRLYRPGKGYGASAEAPARTRQAKAEAGPYYYGTTRVVPYETMAPGKEIYGQRIIRGFVGESVLVSSVLL